MISIVDAIFVDRSMNLQPSIDPGSKTSILASRIKPKSPRSQGVIGKDVKFFSRLLKIYVRFVVDIAQLYSPPAIAHRLKIEGETAVHR